MCPGKVADVVIIADASTSIGPLDFSKQLTFISNVTNNFEIGPDNVQVGMITFSTEARKEFALNRYKSKAELRAAVKRVRVFCDIKMSFFFICISYFLSRNLFCLSFSTKT